MSFESEVKAVVFTSPMANGGNHITLLTELIDNTPRNGVIHVCISHFGYKPLADRLIAATQRRVLVRMIMEAHPGIENNEIKEYIESNSRIRITMAHGCYGSKIHTKLFLFSVTRLNGNLLRHVAVFGSATMTEASLEKHQDMCVVADEPFYLGLRNHWQQMLENANPAPIDDEDAETVPANTADVFSTSGRVKAYFFPRSSDPVLNVINNLNGDVHNATGKRPRIRIAISRWTTGRERIVDALFDRVKDGCIVDLIARIDPAGDDGVDPRLIDGIPSFELQNYSDRIIIHIGWLNRVRENLHNKYFLIEGYYGGGSEWETIVWTGSPNWTNQGLKYSDELMVKFRDAELYNRYVGHHEVLKMFCERWMPIF